MNEGEQLLLILSLIYLSGCLVWVDRRTVVFASWFRGRWRSVVADYHWGNVYGRVYLLNPLPPMGMICATRILPVSISPERIVAYNVQTVGNSGRPAQSRKMCHIRPEMRFQRKGTFLHIDGLPFCDIGDILTAHRLIVLLNRMKKGDATARERAISDFWEERLDVRKTKSQIRASVVSSRPACALGSLCLLCMALIAILAAALSCLGLAVLVGAGFLIISAALICLDYWLCRRRFHPLFKDGFWGEIVKMVLCPPSALRCGDLIMRRLSAGLDVLPMAKLLLRGDMRRDFLANYLQDLENPSLPEGLDEGVRETCLWQNKIILKLHSLHRNKEESENGGN